VGASIALLSFTFDAVAAAPPRSQAPGRFATTLPAFSYGNQLLPRSPDRRVRRDSTVVELDSDGLANVVAALDTERDVLKSAEYRRTHHLLASRLDAARKALDASYEQHEVEDSPRYGHR